MDSKERQIIIIIAALLALGVSLFLSKKVGARWRLISFSVLFLTFMLEIYYYFFVINPSHGIGILILPLASGWLAWRQENTGKPAISPFIFFLLQLAYCLIYIIIVFFQEH